MGHEIFHHRKIVIATMHRKEEVIAPLLLTHLQVHPRVPENFDTDRFGTFSGEVERKLDPLSTAREKCRMAMQASGCDLAVASEGSFGMHPAAFFIPCNEEWVLLVDAVSQLEIVARVLSADTNFSGQWVHSSEELEKFARQAGFPEHGLILRNAKDETAFLKKGITTWKNLEAHFSEALKLFDGAYVETDMRALYNPKRMEVIRQATEKLVKRTLTSCPHCDTPGFGITGAEPGLPCWFCGLPTKSTLHHVYSCNCCGFSEKIKNPVKTEEEPTFCDYCNP